MGAKQIDQAAGLVLTSAPDVLGEVTWSSDGSTPWLGLANSDSIIESRADSSAYDFESFIMLASDVAKDPTVRRVILQREQQLQRQCLSASDSNFSLCASDLDDWSTEATQTSAYTVPASPVDSVCGSDMLLVENQCLREENARLKAELRRSVDAVSVARNHVNAIVNTAVKRAITQATARAVGGKVAAEPKPSQKAASSPPRGGLPYNAAVVAAAMAVGLLAILLSRNPTSAKMAATTTAALCFSLLQRVNPRHPARAQRN